MKKIAILQSNYIPWKGYFDLINSVDEFVILDTVQYTRRDWRNRNKIKTNSGLQWLTIPLSQKNNYYANINEMKILNAEWTLEHLNIIKNHYKNAPYFTEVFAFLENLYLKVKDLTLLSKVNELIIKEICNVLNINTQILRAESLGDLSNSANERLINICLKREASCYLSGPSAKNYMDLVMFEENNIYVEWMDYRGYCKYNQLYGEFIHEVSIIDVLFNVGLENAYKYISKPNN